MMIFGVLIILGLVMAPACQRDAQVAPLPQMDTGLQLDQRLAGVNFSIVQSDLQAVRTGFERLNESTVLPEQWPIDFASTQVEIPDVNPLTDGGVDPSRAVGISHTDGRTTVVYLFPDISAPAYGQFCPLAVAQYVVPEVNMNLVFLLVCFQSDPNGAIEGLGARAIDPSGQEISAPFSLATSPGNLRGKFFYDEFISSSDRQAVAARSDWDRGFMLLSRLGPDIILSTYLPWY